MEKIKCNVINCKYNKNGGCMASAIEINIDNGEERASDYQMTNCHTFEPK